MILARKFTVKVAFHGNHGPLVLSMPATCLTGFRAQDFQVDHTTTIDTVVASTKAMALNVQHYAFAHEFIGLKVR
jgi:hypothetical protein